MAGLRIIAGRLRGRVLPGPTSEAARPTAERVREAIFNVLAHGLNWPGLAGAPVIDAFAGTGALGFEALSRGAASAIFIDIDAGGLAAIRSFAAAIGEETRVTALRLDAARLPWANASAPPAALAFLDPPYRSGLAAPALQRLGERGWLAAGAVVVVEIAAGEALVLPPGFALLDERPYGAAQVLFLEYEGVAALTRTG
jgi:16S rRNA (guanine966-N2)-methyltransferase